jgi:hypothetical protein
MTGAGRWAWWAAFGALVALSLATGVTKLVRMPAEMALFRGAGFSDALTLAFGALQVAGGLLLLHRRTRRAGAALMAATFAVAAWVVWQSGMRAFFGLSLAFVLLALLPVWHPSPPDRSGAQARGPVSGTPGGRS